MPTYFTHHSFGDAVLAALPAGMRQQCNHHRLFFDLGLQGADLLEVSAKRKPIIAKQHQQLLHRPFSEFLAHAQSRLCGDVYGDYMAYLYGFLCYATLEEAFGRYLQQQALERGRRKGYEEALEERLLEQRHGVTRLAAKFHITDAVRLATFFPLLSPGDMLYAVQAMLEHQMRTKQTFVTTTEQRVHARYLRQIYRESVPVAVAHLVDFQSKCRRQESVATDASFASAILPTSAGAVRTERVV